MLPSPRVALHGRKTSAHDRAATVSEQVDRELVTSALRKREAGQQPTAQELATATSGLTVYNGPLVAGGEFTTAGGGFPPTGPGGA
jgi:hypothetical protein